MFSAKKLETTSTTKKQQYMKNGKVRFRLNVDVRKEMEDSRLNAIECLKTDYVRKRWNRELTQKCKFKCYVKPMKDPLGVTLTFS